MSRKRTGSGPRPPEGKRCAIYTRKSTLLELMSNVVYAVMSSGDPVFSDSVNEPYVTNDVGQVLVTA